MCRRKTTGRDAGDTVDPAVPLLYYTQHMGIKIGQSENYGHEILFSLRPRWLLMVLIGAACLKIFFVGSSLSRVHIVCTFLAKKKHPQRKARERELETLDSRA